MENSGNEAKKYLKTKEDAVLNVANSALFARKTTHFGTQKEQKAPRFAKTKLSSPGAGHGLKAIHCRLDVSRGAGALPVVLTGPLRSQRARRPHHASHGLTAFQIPWYSNQVSHQFMSPQ